MSRIREAIIKNLSIIAILLVIGVLLWAFLGGYIRPQPRTVSVAVAAYNSSRESKTHADYVCDGVADEVEIATAIINLNNAGGGSVLLSEGTFILSQPIVPYRHNPLVPIHPFSLRGSGAATVLDGSAIGENAPAPIINIYGATFTEPDFREPLLTTDAYEGQHSIMLADASGLSVGDYIMISSDGRYSANTRGELQRITSIQGKVITLEESLFDSYLVADNAKVTRKLLAQDITLSDFKILANKAHKNAGILVTDAANISIHDVTVMNANYAGISLRNTIFSRIFNCRIEGSSLKGLGYAVTVSLASRNNSVYGNTMTNSVKAITVGGGPGVGVTRFTNVYGNNASNVDHGFETHGEADYTIFANNLVSNTYGHAFAACDNHVKITHNVIKNHNNNGKSSDPAILGGGQATDIDITGNTIIWNPSGTKGQEWGILVDGSKMANVVIKDNYLDGYAIPIRVIRALGNCQITGNTIRNPASGGYGIYFENDNDNSKNVTIADNDIDGRGKLAAGIVVETRKGARVDRLRIRGNNSYNNAGYGIRIWSTDTAANAVRDVIITENNLYDDQGVATQKYGLQIEGNIDDVTIRLNTFRRNTGEALKLAGWASNMTSLQIGDNIGYVYYN